MEEQTNTMPNLTTNYGLFLLSWGLIATYLSDAQSFTSFLPSLLGLALLVSGEMAKIPEKKKLWMHVAVTFGLIGALGGTRFFMVMADGLNYANSSMLMLLLTGTAYTVLCVRSFIAARKAREAAETEA